MCGRPPTGFDATDAYEDLPSLVDVVRRARETEPARRYESAQSMRAAIDWIEIESERHNAQTQDIPLWMEMSVVANIPVTDLIRGKSGAPPSQPPGRKSEPPRSRFGAVPMPVGPGGRSNTPRSSGSFTIPPAPKLPIISEDQTPLTNPKLDVAIELDVDLEATPVSLVPAPQVAAPTPTRSPVVRWLALGVILVASVALFTLLFID